MLYKVFIDRYMPLYRLNYALFFTIEGFDLTHILLIDKSLVDVVLNSKGCGVVSGRWISRYEKTEVTKARSLDIDHVIPLYWMHRHGGENWSAKKKSKFANDRRNLRVTTAKANRTKSAKGIDEWLPINSVSHCDYARSWQTVGLAYEVVFPASTQAKIEAILSGC